MRRCCIESIRTADHAPEADLIEALGAFCFSLQKVHDRSKSTEASNRASRGAADAGQGVVPNQSRSLSLASEVGRRPERCQFNEVDRTAHF